MIITAYRLKIGLENLENSCDNSFRRKMRKVYCHREWRISENVNKYAACSMVNNCKNSWCVYFDSSIWLSYCFLNVYIKNQIIQYNSYFPKSSSVVNKIICHNLISYNTALNKNFVLIYFSTPLHSKVYDAIGLLVDLSYL